MSVEKEFLLQVFNDFVKNTDLQNIKVESNFGVISVSRGTAVSGSTNAIGFCVDGAEDDYDEE